MCERMVFGHSGSFLKRHLLSVQNIPSFVRNWPLAYNISYLIRRPHKQLVITLIICGLIIASLYNPWWALLIIFLVITIIVFFSSMWSFINRQQLFGILILSVLLTFLSLLIPFNIGYKTMLINTIPLPDYFLQNAWGYPSPFSGESGIHFDLFFIDVLIYYLLIFITITSIRLKFFQDKQTTK